MANPIVQTTSAGATVATVAGPGGEGYQLIKLVDGSGTQTTPVVATSGVPAAGTLGLVVAVKPGVSVSAQVSGTVAISGPAQVSGTVAVNNFTTAISGSVSISGTPTVALAQTSVVAQVSGTVTVNQTTNVSGTVTAILPGSTTGSSGMSGVLVWLGASQTVLISTQVSGTVTVNGSVSVSGTAIVSVVPGVSVNLGSLATVVATTTGVSGATGPIVWLGASQTVLVTIAGGAGGGGSVVTTQAGGTSTGQLVYLAANQTITVVPSVTVTVTVNASTTASIPTATATGLQVWLVGGQTAAGAPVIITGTVALPTGTVSVSGTVPVTGTINLINTVATLLGTVQVSVVAGGAAPGTTALTQSNVSGQVVWLAPTQTMALVNTVGALLTGTVNVATGTISVSGQVPVSGTVTAIPLNQTTAHPTSTATGQVVRAILYGSVTGTDQFQEIQVNTTGQLIVTMTGAQQVVGTVNVSTLSTIIGIVSVTQAPGLSVNVGGMATVAITTTAVPAAASTAYVVAVKAGASVTALVSGTVTVNGSVTVASGTVNVLDVGRTQVMIVVASSALGNAGTTLAFTVYQGATQLTAATTGWTVPVGKVFRILNIQVLAQNSITTTPVDHELYVLVSNTIPTMTPTSPRVAGVMVDCASQGLSFSACGVGIADVTAASTIGIGYSNNAAGSLVRAFINGYLFP